MHRSASEDDRPRLLLAVQNPRAAEWRDGKPEFTVQHCGGVAAQFIKIDPITSLRHQNLRISFSEVDFLDADTPIAPVSVSLNGINQETAFETEFFNRDSRYSVVVSYPIFIRFRWMEKQDEEWMWLLWNARTRELEVKARNQE